MTLMHRQSQAFRFGAPLGIVALAASVGCGVPGGGTVSAQPAAANAQPAAAAPIVVSCEPNQRTLVRPVVVNGATVSQIECITNSAPVMAAQAQTFAPVQQPVEYRQVRAAAPAVVDDLGDARVVTAERPAAPAAVTPARQVVYRDEVPLRKKRTVAKSAVIIGSTAGAGAGVGALIGGKKGALIGAAVGGGGATLWDQITRRKD